MIIKYKFLRKINVKFDFTFDITQFVIVLCVVCFFFFNNWKNVDGVSIQLSKLNGKRMQITSICLQILAILLP